MAELHVSKKNISNLLGHMQGKKFVIPDYQRPYKWDFEKCQTLWNDIENFSLTDGTTGADYFLGTIVTYLNDDNNPEIIDGQQRVTSFFLMLRAFYRKLDDTTVQDAEVIGLKNQLAPCIWDINELSLEVSDKTKIHIISEVATTEDNEVFHNILVTGHAEESANDNYSINYRFFKKQCDEYAANNPLQWKQLCLTVLKKCIVLPIECDRQETALTIFSTLNDRGLPLADSDIFKAQIYKYLPASERKSFTDTWKELTAICDAADMSIDEIFRYYTHVLRARAGDRSKEVGLRNFYSKDKYARLKVPELMEEIMLLADFWHTIYVEKGFEKDMVGYEISEEAWKYIHCLFNYPNEFWKYATSVFFLRNRGDDFSEAFVPFLKKLTAFLFAKFIDAPTVNAIKDDIYQACISLQQNNQLDVSFVPDAELRNKIKYQASAKLSRGLLLLHGYQHPLQHDCMVWGFELEHIFPKKWQDTNYNGWNEEDAAEYLDRFGNKIVIEKKLNIQAGNGYFGKKKLRYVDSTIAVVKELGILSQTDWLKNDIVKREEAFFNDLMQFFEEQLNIPAKQGTDNSLILIPLLG